MANSNAVGTRYPDSFGNYVIGTTSAPVGLGSTGNAVAIIPTIGTSYIVRRITVAGANGSVALANVTIFTSNDGVLANAVSNATVLGNITATTKFQDLNLTANTATTIYSGSLFLCVNTAAAANNTVEISVYGDVVTL
jgi:hypothetical protein